MKIVYAANVRMPTEKAHGAQIMKTCEAFVECGHEVELVVPDRKTPITEDPFAYYGVARRFPLRRLPVWDTVSYGKVGFLFETFMFARAVRRFLRGASYDVLFGRDELILAQLPAPYVWESHTGAWNRAAQTVVQKASHIIAISQGLKDAYTAHGVPAAKITVAHDGIDLSAFEHRPTKEEARSRLGLPRAVNIAMYIGRLDGWKGTDTLLDASKQFSEDTLLAVVGGEVAQVAAVSRRYPKVRFLGYRPYKELAANMAAADVLVLPNTGKDQISKSFTSPLKLFAYMASGVPIVASDLPSIREVLDEESAVLVTPDDAAALALGINEALAKGNDKAATALRRVAEYSWKRRAERIVAALAGNASAA